MELNEVEAKLEELGKILLADDGFFTQMPKEQFDAFGKAIKLIARIEATKVLHENKSNMICDMVNVFTGNIRPVAVGGEEPMPPMMEDKKTPNIETQKTKNNNNTNQTNKDDKKEENNY